MPDQYYRTVFFEDDMVLSRLRFKTKGSPSCTYSGIRPLLLHSTFPSFSLSAKGFKYKVVVKHNTPPHLHSSKHTYIFFSIGFLIKYICTGRVKHNFINFKQNSKYFIGREFHKLQHMVICLEK